jgi:methionine synthase II (cobalamin-independent)
LSISKDMLIEDIVEQYPETIGPMQQMGIQCMLCGEPVWGTLEEKVKEKGLSNLDDIVNKLNEIINGIK